MVRPQIWPRSTRAHGGSDDLVERIRERLTLPAIAGLASRPALPERATVDAIEAAEESLDFALPSLLKQLLREVANGGFGPGHGLLGVRDGATDEHGNSLVDLYDSLSAPNPEDAGWRWPEHLVALCPWGDSTYSCIDCSTGEGRLVTFDLNGYKPGTELACQLVSQELSLEAWLRGWVDGVDFWSQMFPLD
jgi:hypothetical protein